MCLLTLKDTRALINQLLSEGYIQYQELTVKAQGQVIMYGINFNAWKQALAYKMAKCNLNLLIREQKHLNFKTYCALELNHLIL